MSERPARLARGVITVANRQPGQRVPPAAQPGRRRAVEQASARPLLYLRQLPRWLPPALLAALLIAGLAVTGWPGAVALLLVAAFLGWLAYISWPSLHPQGRLLRTVAIIAVIGLAIVQVRR